MKGAKLAAEWSKPPKASSPSSITVDRLTVSNLKIIDQWAERGQALMKMAPYLASEMLYANLMDLIPREPAWIGYRRALRHARVGAKTSMIYAVYAKPTFPHDRLIKANEEVLYVRPRKNRLRPVAPEVETLEKFSPWTMSTLPFSPKSNQATIVTRRASEREIKSIENARNKDRPKWQAELQKAGIRNVNRNKPLNMVDTNVVSDIAFTGLRLEFGYGGTKRVPHWRPGIRAAIKATKRLFLKRSPYTKVMTSSASSNSWKRWPPKVQGHISEAQLKNFAKFQKKLRTRGERFAGGDRMNAQMSGLLEQMRTQLVAEQGWNPALEADSDQMDGDEVFDAYLSDLLDVLMADYDVSDEDALDFVFSVADEQVEAGTLPPIPDDDADAGAVVEWVEAAKAAGLEAAVMAAAEESAEEAE